MSPGCGRRLTRNSPCPRDVLPYRASEILGVSLNFGLSIVSKVLIDLKTLRRRNDDVAMKEG
jgi:hypothetical protein